MVRIRSSAFAAALAGAALWCQAQETPTPGAAPPAAPSATPGLGDATLAPPDVAEAAPATESADYESDIRKADQAYVDAFNAKDAKAVAALWSAEAVYVDRRTGEEVVGREAIAAEYAALFESSPDLTLAVESDSIQLLSPGVVVEHGVATFKAPDSVEESVSFVAVWIRRDGGWLLDRVSDEAEVNPSPQYEHLRELEWMIGEWVDQDDQVAVETTCRWTKNKNFLVREFAVSAGDEIEISGMQIVGWNPTTKRIHSWTFDSDGGYAEGTWSSSDGRWLIRNRGFTSEGDPVATTNVIRRIDDDSFGWRTTDRIVNGELLPSVDESVVIRRP